MSDLRQEVRRVITNAYYDARNEGETMETAADRAADSVMAVLPDYEAAVDALEALLELNLGADNHSAQAKNARAALARLRPEVPA